MSFFHPIHTIEDRERMVKKMLSLQTQIRTKRKKERLVDKSRNQKYAKIFEPITRTLKDLSDIPPSKSTENLIDTETPPVDDLIDLKPDVVEKREADEEQPNPGELYRATLKMIPLKDRDDGTFGLNTDTQKIGDYAFTVDGNLLKVINDDDADKREYVIDDIQVWIILLAKAPGNYMSLKRPSNSPSKRKTTTSYVSSVKMYIEIANDLNLLETAERYGGKYYKRLSKYQILKNARSGKGFLFSVKPPPFATGRHTFFNPSTVVIPSDNKGLMRELTKALAELRAGNTSMRNLVVPLAQEARRKRILPDYLLSPDEETWVFA